MVVGFYGKLPSRADFVGKGLAESFLNPMDAWLRVALAEARADLGARWHEVFLSAPVWRFALAAGLAGPAAVAGVLVPSMDRSGREFPFIVALCTPEPVRPAALAAAASGWLDRARQAAVAAVRRGLDPAEVERMLAQLPSPALPAPCRPATAGGGWRVDGAGSLGAALPQLLDIMAGAQRPSLWWSDGSDLAQPASLMLDGLPPATAFAAFLDGGWTQRGL